MAKGSAGKGARKAHKKETLSATTNKDTLANAPNRAARRNAANQHRNAKKAALAYARRQNAAAAPPTVVALIDTADAHQQSGAALLANAMRAAADAVDDDGATTLHVHKGRITLLRAARAVPSALGAMKAADVMLLVIPADGGMDALGEAQVDAVCLQGVSHVVGVLTGVEQLPEKRRAAVRREWAASLAARFPSSHKFFSLDLDPTCSHLLRHLAAATPKQLTWREQRPYVLAHSYRLSLDEEPAAAEGSGERGGVLEVCGFVRGQPLSADRLVHIAGLGDLPLDLVEILPVSSRRGLPPADDDAMGEGDTGGMQLDPLRLVPDTQRRMDLAYEAEVDPTLGEQTWPTEEELASALPRVYEQYDSGWNIPEGDDEGEEGEVVRAADGMDRDPMDAEVEQLGVGEVEEARARYLELRAKRDEDARFPDEVDTPVDKAARQRFARYRGLKSFRSSEWHPQENLPPEYARVYKFVNWPTVQRHALREQAERHAEGCAPVGSFVRLVLRVPAKFESLHGGAGGADAPSGAPLVLSSLSTHENRLTVVHFTFTLTAEAERAQLVVRGKEELVFCCGFRTMVCTPIFSEDVRGGDGGKYKLERFVQKGRQCVATVYAPALYAPAPLLAFLPQARAAETALSGLPVASGSLLAVDTDRIILKRVVLAGHPFKCHKRRAVVRWMFFNSDDVRWFKPVELHTKFGRKGHIREPLGTHGFMKCYFDGTMLQHDTVCMALYKRAFPKWAGRARFVLT